MRAMLRGVVGLGLVALLAGPALAQGQGRGFGMMGGGNSLSGLIGNESIQKELKLDDTQTTKLKELAEKNQAARREKMADAKDLEPEERRTKMMEITKEMNESTTKAIGEFLKPEQIARLHQCVNQVRGVQAFSDPDVAKKLNLTDAQKGEIKTITDERMQGIRDLGLDFQNDREGSMKKIAEYNKETLGKVVAKLNDEQQKTWKEMLGSPFEYTPTPFRRPNQ